jgi:hypothetical protein
MRPRQKKRNLSSSGPEPYPSDNVILATARIEHIAASAVDWGLSHPKKVGEDERKRPLAAVATDLNGRLKQCCKAADSPSKAMLEMRSHLTLFSRYGLPNEKATQLVRDLAMQAFTAPQKR